MLLIIDRLLPFSMVEHDSFISFVKALDSRYDPPGRKAIITQIHKTYNCVRENLQADLKSISSVAITHDAWTSINTQSFDTVTVHYISKTWELKAAVLRTEHFPGSHTGENIAKALQDTKEAWKLPNIIAVTDNAANERKAFTVLDWPRIGCYGHMINLVVKGGLAVADVAKLIARGRSVVTYFHQSPLAMNVLNQKQKVLLSEEAQGHKLIQDVATRWNSTLDMLKRLSEQTPALHAAVLDPSLGKKGVELRSKLYTFEQQIVIDSIVLVLEPFKTATVKLSAEKTPTHHLVVPILKKLEITLTAKEDDGALVRKFNDCFM